MSSKKGKHKGSADGGEAPPDAETTCFGGMAFLSGFSDSYSSLALSTSENKRSAKVSVGRISGSMLMIWFSYILELGKSKELDYEDLPILPKSMTTVFNSTSLFNCWRASASAAPASNSKSGKANGKGEGYSRLHGEDKDRAEGNKTGRGNPRDPKASRRLLFSLIWKEHRWGIIFVGLLKFVRFISMTCFPIFSGFLVNYFNDTDTNPAVGYGWALSMWITFYLFAYFTQTYLANSFIVSGKMRASLTPAVFLKSLSLPTYVREELSLTEAKLTTLIQVDIDKVCAFLSDAIHPLWLGPFNLVVLAVLLFFYIGVAYLPSFFCMVALLPFNATLATKIQAASKKMMAAKDKRLQIMSEAIGSIESMKMLGLEDAVEALSNKYREEELLYLKKLKMFAATREFAVLGILFMCTNLTFGVAIGLGIRFNVGQALTVIGLQRSIWLPLLDFTMSLFKAFEVKISLGRLGDVLLHPDGKALMLIDKDAKRDITDDDKYRGHGSGSSQVDLQVENAMWQCGSSFVPTKVMEKDAPSTSVSDANASPAFSLGPVTFSASRGHVVGVVGGTGSGKSTLLLALLGELQIQNGDVNGRLTKACDPGIHDPPVGRSSTVPIDLMDRYLEASYCSQIPHIHSLNVRDNILMGRELDEVRYRQVLEGCQLHHDINEGNWHDGDLHDCGENGSALSGGQRLRLGVARALYSTKPIVLLDDPFSALDERTGTALMSFIREVVSTEQNRLVIVATHHVHLFRQANAVMVLDGGTVVGMGKYQDLHENEFFVKLLGEEDELRKKKQKEAKVSGAGNAVDSTSLKEQEVADKKSDSEDAPAETEAKKATDVVHKDHLHKGVIKIYADTFGTSTLVIWMFALFVVMATQSGNTVFVFEFPEHRGVISNTQFYIVAAFMFSSNFVAQYITTFYLYEGCLKVSRRVYQRLTRSVLYTFVAFFEVTSIGKIVNRFGKDTFAVDDLLPDKASRGVMLTMNVTGGIFLAIFFAWYSIPILIALVFAYYYLQDYYRQTARVLRRLDSAYQSPLYTLTCDCIGNSVTLRSLEPEVFSHFVRELENALDGAMRTSLSVRVAAVWVGGRLQLLGFALPPLIGIIAVTLQAYSGITISPSTFAAGMAFATRSMDSLNNLLTTLPEIEQELISAERVLEYCDLPPEEPMGDRDDVHIFKNPMHEKGSNSHKLLGDGYAEGNVEFVSSHGVSETDTNNGWNDSSTTRYARLEEGPREAQDCTGEGEAWRDWPRSSVVEMQNVYLQYGPHQPYALKDVNVRIEEGSRVAIIGRTGSGKSSLLRAILRMSAFKGGVILGGLDTKALPLSVLRKQLVVLPQAAALFTGSVRMNLDPANVYTDDQVARALADCGVIETMRRNDGTSSPISDGVEAKELLVSVAESVKLLTREERLAKARDLLSMQVKDAGNDLSYGQRQLLSLARSLLRLQSTAKVGAGAGHQAGVSRIMIIDEATAAVDAYSEAMLRIVLRNLFGMESQSPHDNQTDNVDALEADLRRRTTLLMICHKEDGIRTLCNHELKMNDGSVEYFKQI